MEYHGVLSNCSLPGYAWIAAVGCYCELDFPSIDWFAACSTVWCTLGRLRVWQVSLVADPGAACCLTCRCSHTPVGYWWTLIKLKHGFVGKCWKIGYLSLNPVFFWIVVLMIRHQRQDVVAGVQQMLHYIEEPDAFIAVGVYGLTRLTWSDLGSLQRFGTIDTDGAGSMEAEWTPFFAAGNAGFGISQNWMGESAGDPFFNGGKNM